MYFGRSVEEQLNAVRNALKEKEEELAEAKRKLEAEKKDTEGLHAELKLVKKETRNFQHRCDTALNEIDEFEPLMEERMRRYTDLKARYDQEIPSLTAENSNLKAEHQKFDDAMTALEAPLVELLNSHFRPRKGTAAQH